MPASFPNVPEGKRELPGSKRELPEGNPYVPGSFPNVPESLPDAPANNRKGDIKMPSYKLSEIYNAFVRARDLGAQDVRDFPAESKGAQNLALIAAGADAIEAGNAVRESGALKQKFVLQGSAIAAVLEDLRDINATARAIAVDEPGFLEMFRMVDGDSPENVLASAEAIHRNAVEHQTKFLEYEIRADFIEDLAADIAALREAVEGKNVASGTQIGSTALKIEAVEEGLRAMRRLRGVVRNKYRDNPAKLAAWNSALHIRRSPAGNSEPPAAPN